MRHFFATTPFILAILFAIALPATALPTDAHINSLLDTIAKYNQGDSRLALLELEDLVNHSTASLADKKHLADLIAPRLATSATNDAKMFLCRQLHTGGSPSHVPALAPLLTDEKLSHMARYALQRIPGAEARDALHTALHQTTGKTLVGVINSVGLRADPTSAAQLSPFLQDPDTNAALAAADALGYIPTVATLKAIDIGYNTASPKLTARLNLAAIQAAQGLQKRGRNNAPTMVYERLIASSYPDNIRIACLTGLAETLNEQAATQKMLAVVANNDKPLIPTALRKLQFLDSPQITTTLIDQIDTVDDDTRFLIINTLAMRGDTTATPILIQYAQTGSEEDQLAAVTALATAGDNNALAPLALIASTNTGALRDAAKLSLTRINEPRTNAAVLGAAKTLDEKPAAVLIDSLILRNATDTTPALLKLAGDSQTPPAVTRAAFNSLAALAPADQLPALISLMTQQTDGASRGAAQRAIALVAVNALDPNAASAPVVAAHAAASATDARVGLIQILGKIATPAAYQAVNVDLQSADAKVADAALRALAAWPNDQPLDALASLAKSASSNTQRILALRGYIRLIPLNKSRPAEASIALFKNAIDTASRPDEKKLALAGLASVHTLEANLYAKSLMRDPALNAEAKQTAQAIQRELTRAARLKELEAERAKTFK